VHPVGLHGWLFDLDGVLTDTASVHVVAWKDIFDELLERLDQPPFDPVHDYVRYVDGKPRAAGVRDFLASRGIVLPEGGESDDPQADTVAGVGRRKNARFLELLSKNGVATFPSSIAFVRALRDAGRCTAVVSASENCVPVLVAAGIGGLFHVIVDGAVAEREHLAGKPAPDTFLHAAGLLGIRPDEAAVVEDAPAGVAAGRAGGFAYVVGIARRATGAELLEAGAHVVVADLGDFAALLEMMRASRAALRPEGPLTTGGRRR
jgi:beta-phosphoglucomutase family hydrolase